MENIVISRAYLESLSFSDLQRIADEYSIDVPENFNRGFLIGEILDLSDEFKNKNEEAEMNITEGDISNVEKDIFPCSYNTTEVEIILRNPAWAYIYWNI